VGVAVALLLALATASPAGGVQIRSDVDCPSGAEVAARLRALLGHDASSSATLSITRDASALTLALRDASGSVVDMRTWPASDDCAGTAEAFAVVIAAWLGDLPLVANTVAAPARASSETVITKPAATARRAALLTVVVSAGASSPVSRVAPAERAWPAPALALDVLARPSASSSGFAGIALFANLPREHDYGSGAYSYWYRVGTGPEVGLEVRHRRFSVMMSGGVSAGALVARSSGIIGGTAYATSVIFDVAAFADLRAGCAFGSTDAPWNLWLAAHGRAELRPYADDADQRLPEAAFEAALLVGADYSWPW
jgi:hypothetical protein